MAENLSHDVINHFNLSRIQSQGRHLPPSTFIIEDLLSKYIMFLTSPQGFSPKVSSYFFNVASGSIYTRKLCNMLHDQIADKHRCWCHPKGDL
jgi:hypothetical protein